MQIINANKENVPPVEISWDDFATEITIDDFDCVPISMSYKSQELQAVFITAKNNPIQNCENQSVTIGPQSSSKASQNFSSKPPIKVPFNDNSAQPCVKNVKLNSPNFINNNNRRQVVVIESKEINTN